MGHPIQPLDVLRDVLRLAGMRIAERAVLWALVMHARNEDGAVWVSARTLSDELGASIRTIEAKLRQLRTRGLIVLVQRRKQTSNVYRVRPEVIAGLAVRRPAGVAGGAGGAEAKTGNPRQEDRQTTALQAGNRCRLSASPDLHKRTAREGAPRETRREGRDERDRRRTRQAEPTSLGTILRSSDGYRRGDENADPFAGENQLVRAAVYSLMHGEDAGPRANEELAAALVRRPQLRDVVTELQARSEGKRAAGGQA
jgi:hypothetical protein